MNERDRKQEKLVAGEGIMPALRSRGKSYSFSCSDSEGREAAHLFLMTSSKDIFIIRDGKSSEYE